ncbi:hypothetical protein RUM44_010719 [Polyplax serrata]|uniref:Uncharacterized protein n=1 Tax=Polyplax serrata TaxID=468196 RepID=A0ABR1APS0_POLSC
MAARQLENEAPNPERIQLTGRRAHEGHRRGRPGQGAKTRNQDRFRSKINSKQSSEDRTGIEQRHGLTEEGAVEKLFSSVECGESGYAVLLPVSSRGIGFASVLEYQRFAGTDSISIHSCYRVMLHLFQLKMSLSYRSQTLAPNHPLEIMQPLPSDDLNLLMGISQVPLATYTILHSLGTAHTPDDYYPVPRHPGSSTPIAVRTGFLEHNPIPGARWADMLLTNIDSTWPADYGYGQLSFDVRAYQPSIHQDQF